MLNGIGADNVFDAVRREKVDNRDETAELRDELLQYAHPYQSWESRELEMGD